MEEKNLLEIIRILINKIGEDNFEFEEKCAINMYADAPIFYDDNVLRYCAYINYK